jgi:hypothetical protein
VLVSVQTKLPACRASAPKPAAKDRTPAALFSLPPGIIEELPVAAFCDPPATTPQLLAVFCQPPATVACDPVAAFPSPPPMAP